MPGKYGNCSPADVGKYLKGTVFPASRRDLRLQAEDNGADPEIIDVILTLPEDEYGSIADVLVAYGVDRPPPSGPG